MHWSAGSGHLGTMKILAEHFDLLTDVDKYGRNALHWAALAGHKNCALWLVSKAKGTTLIHSLTLTNKSPSRCAFEAGYAALAAKLQALEEGHDEVISEDYSHTESKKSPPESPAKKLVKASSNAVSDWLHMLELEEYADNFSKDGFDSLRGITTVNERDLIDMNVKKGHRRVVLSGIEHLKQQLAILDENARAANTDPERAPSVSDLPQLSQSSKPDIGKQREEPKIA